MNVTGPITSYDINLVILWLVVTTVILASVNYFFTHRRKVTTQRVNRKR